jgi:hypothetical protein
MRGTGGSGSEKRYRGEINVRRGREKETEGRDRAPKIKGEICRPGQIKGRYIGHLDRRSDTKWRREETEGGTKRNQTAEIEGRKESEKQNEQAREKQAQRERVVRQRRRKRGKHKGRL